MRKHTMRPRPVPSSGIVAILLALVCVSTACSREQQPGMLDPSSVAYAECASSFYVGVAALQVGDFPRADQKLTRVTELAPREPAGWANLGLLALRQRDFDLGFERLQKASALAPDMGEIYALLGYLERERGQSSRAITSFGRAIELGPQNTRALFALAREFERQNDNASEAQAQRLFDQILQIQPDNLPALIELARISAKRGDSEALANTIDRLSSAGEFPAEARQQLEALKNAAADDDLRDAALQATFFAHLLASSERYQQDLNRLQAPIGQVGEPITHLVTLPSPSASPAPPDYALSFAPQSIPGIAGGRWEWVGLVYLDVAGDPVVAVSNGKDVQLANGTRLSFPGGSSATPPFRDSILSFDFDYDFKTDFALAGPGGLRIYRQDSGGTFSDVTTTTGLPGLITKASYATVWAADIESDGDLDLILARDAGPPTVLGNNGDGTLKKLELFGEVSSPRGFVWADLDGDGDADASMIDALGRLFVFDNHRLGVFGLLPVPVTLDRIVGLTVADPNSDSILDLILLQADGAVLRLSQKDAAGNWETAEVARWPGSSSEVDGRSISIFPADLDNNGSTDLIASGARDGMVWLGDEEGGFQALATSVPLGRIFSFADLTDDGHLDLIGVSQAGEPVLFLNRSQRDYQWKVVRARAAQSSGDRRINPFGIGGAIEVRSGLLVQKQLITGPAVHFGVGKSTDVDMVRIFWPNGFVQAEFEIKSDLPDTAPTVFDQRLEGSCPFVFAYDGTEMSFVTDFIWRSPLGLRINAQNTADVMQTEDWIKIRGDMLQPRDGFYDVRITADLWETHFIDHVSLMVVDHPPMTEVFVDERFSVTPPQLAVHLFSPLRSFERAWDDSGLEVSDAVRSRDGRYLDTFDRGPFQGVSRDHWVEVEIGEAVDAEELWLVANGWVHPTDSSINVAISQGGHARPQGLSLEVPDGKGGWVVVKPDLGFPSGKNKTILVNLAGVFRAGTHRRIRLRTNLEVYWDSIEFAEALPASPVKTRRPVAHAAELQYRGFSHISAANKSSPELPQYLPLAGTSQRWRDLGGYYTRFGDVRGLLAIVDDRYVIMNAGDELRFLFEAPADPPSGWLRDFVLIGDGWVKDGNFNTTYSKTVLPLPSHDRPNYTDAPGRLQDDPVYRRYSKDWQEYHTRYVAPSGLHNNLRLGNRD